ncbi:MAG: hypothetical protein GY845_30330, partial [Planctomycetes bacterium]|nr:hypothetical protein [Planctomycetota bacterium]
MTKISSRKIRKLLSPWKKLRHIWLWDGQYYIFDMPTLKEVVEKCSVKDIEPKGELFQCEARARWLQTLVGMYQYDLPDMRHKWAFGYCAGRKFNGK